MSAWGEATSATSATAVSRLPESREDFTTAFLKTHSLERVELTMAAGEGEAVLIALEAGDHSLRPIQRVDSSVSIRIYRVGWITVADRLGNPISKPDPLFPLRHGETYRCEEERCLLWVRVSVDSAAQLLPSDSLRLEVTSDDHVTDSIDVVVRSLPVRIEQESRLHLQAALAKVVGPPTERRVAEAYALMSGFKINTSAVNERLIDCSSCLYKRLFDGAGMRSARLAFPNAKRFFRDRDPDPQAISAYVDLVSRSVKSHTSMLERFPDRFHIKLWDEPTAEDRPVAATVYERVKQLFPRISLEVAGARSSGNADTDVRADIDVVRLQDLDISGRLSGSRVSADHTETWLYANTMHSLRRPLHAMRNIGWLIWLLDLDGYHFWNVAYARGDPLTDIFDEKDYFGRGLFLYPDDASGTYVPSLRLASFREGIEDHQLLMTLGESSSRRLRTAVMAEFNPGSGRKRYLSSTEELRRMLNDVLREMADR